MHADFVGRGIVVFLSCRVSVPVSRVRGWRYIGRRGGTLLGLFLNIFVDIFAVFKSFVCLFDLLLLLLQSNMRFSSLLSFAIASASICAALPTDLTNFLLVTTSQIDASANTSELKAVSATSLFVSLYSNHPK